MDSSSIWKEEEEEEEGGGGGGANSLKGRSS